jgi:hypothetical protein
MIGFLEILSLLVMPLGALAIAGFSYLGQKH